MNARAAWRLEQLGFAQVYRYAAGKADWLAAGLPSEGRKAGALRAWTIARRDVPTCGPGERVGDAARRARQVGSDVCLNASSASAANLGLLAEEIEPGSGEQLGNVPQAFTHIGLINAGLILNLSRS